MMMDNVRLNQLEQADSDLPVLHPESPQLAHVNMVNPMRSHPQNHNIKWVLFILNGRFMSGFRTLYGNQTHSKNAVLPEISCRCFVGH